MARGTVVGELRRMWGWHLQVRMGLVGRVWGCVSGRAGVWHRRCTGKWGEAGPRAPSAVDAGGRSQLAVKPPRSGRKHRRPNVSGYMPGTDVLNVSTELAEAAWVSVQTTGTVGRGCRPDRSGRASDAGERAGGGGSHSGRRVSQMGRSDGCDGGLTRRRGPNGRIGGGSVCILRGDA